MEIKHLNNKLYTELPIDELDERLSMEELQDKLELRCWTYTPTVRIKKEPRKVSGSG